MDMSYDTSASTELDEATVKRMRLLVKEATGMGPSIFFSFVIPVLIPVVTTVSIMRLLKFYKVLRQYPILKDTGAADVVTAPESSIFEPCESIRDLVENFKNSRELLWTGAICWPFLIGIGVITVYAVSFVP